MSKMKTNLTNFSASNHGGNFVLLPPFDGGGVPEQTIEVIYADRGVIHQREMTATKILMEHT